MPLLRMSKVGHAQKDHPEPPVMRNIGIPGGSVLPFSLGSPWGEFRLALSTSQMLQICTISIGSTKVYNMRTCGRLSIQSGRTLSR
uniref:Uncharacterized protein n=1 Tax=Pyxicephalus adspersus TaxID=30357 RepID=A0AAV3ALC4_PYXAD|nr:TPA: hypothetical protein GDO54_011484 [Pyxicephalus adspersus]